MSEPNIIPNSFTVYDLTDKDALQGTVLTTLQRQVIQNMLAANAEEKLRLEYDPEKQLDFVQQEAYKRGQIDLLSYILDASTIAVDELNNPTLQD